MKTDPFSLNHITIILNTRKQLNRCNIWNVEVLEQCKFTPIIFFTGTIAIITILIKVIFPSIDFIGQIANTFYVKLIELILSCWCTWFTSIDQERAKFASHIVDAMIVYMDRWFPTLNAPLCTLLQCIINFYLCLHCIKISLWLYEYDLFVSSFTVYLMKSR